MQHRCLWWSRHVIEKAKSGVSFSNSNNECKATVIHLHKGLSILFFISNLFGFLFPHRVGAAVGQDDNSDSRFPKPFDRSYTESKNLVSTSNNHHELFLPQRTARLVSHDRDPQMQNSFNPLPNVINSKHLVKGAVRPSHILPMGNRDVQPILPFPRPRPGTNKNLGFMEKNHSVTSRSSLKYSLVEEDLEIPWSELVLKENIGAGKTDHHRLQSLQTIDFQLLFHACNLFPMG